MVDRGRDTPPGTHRRGELREGENAVAGQERLWLRGNQPTRKLTFSRLANLHSAAR